MFTILGFFGLLWLIKKAERTHHEEVADWTRTHPSDNELVARAIKATRQDVQLIAFLLAGILLMLGVIADNILFADSIRSSLRSWLP